MNNLNNEYEKLLNYYNTQKPKKKPPVKEPKKKKVEKKEKASFNTKKFIEDSRIPAYVPEQVSDKSKGFDVQKFETMMRAKLIEEHKKIQSYERPYISVTELCGCLRQSYYNRMRYPVNLHDQFRFSYLYLIQKIGNKIHEVIEELYDFSETEKTVVSEKYKVKGRIDGIRESFLHEIKSIDDNKLKNTFIQDHYLQGLVYAYILNTEYEYDIKTITIIYVTRSLKKIVSFDIPINNKIAESLLSRALLLNSSIKNSTVPDPFGSTNETCKYCLFKKQCEKDKYKEVKQPFIKGKEKQKEKETQKEDDKTAFLL
jgi:hypothetical protein